MRNHDSRHPGRRTLSRTTHGKAVWSRYAAYESISAKKPWVCRFDWPRPLRLVGTRSARSGVHVLDVKMPYRGQDERPGRSSKRAPSMQPDARSAFAPSGRKNCTASRRARAAPDARERIPTGAAEPSNRPRPRSRFLELAGPPVGPIDYGFFDPATALTCNQKSRTRTGRRQNDRKAGALRVR